MNARMCGTVLLALSLAGCAGSSGRSGEPTTDQQGTPAGRGLGSASYLCALKDLPYDTKPEQQEALTKGTKLFSSGRRFADTPHDRAIGKAATQLLAALQDPGHSPTARETAAGFLSIPDAVAQLKAACG